MGWDFGGWTNSLLKSEFGQTVVDMGQSALTREISDKLGVDANYPSATTQPATPTPKPSDLAQASATVPFYKKWQTYAIGGGVALAGIMGAVLVRGGKK